LDSSFWDFDTFDDGVFWRHDHYNITQCGNPFDDFSPLLQSETIAQDRTLGNLGFRSDLSYVEGRTI